MYISPRTHSQTEWALFLYGHIFSLKTHLMKLSASLGGNGYQFLSKGSSSMSSTQEVPINISLCMYWMWHISFMIKWLKKILYKPQVIISLPDTCEHHCLWPQGATEFWFAGINKCKSHWTLGKWEAAIWASWDQSLASSRGINMASFPVTQ